MEKTLTTEDIIVLIAMISVVYAIINFLQKYFQASLRAQKELQAWGLSLKLNDNQQKYLMDLWAVYKKKKLPDKSMEQLLKENELEELLSYSGEDRLPDSLKKFYKTKKREQFIIKMQKIGFNMIQIKLLSGILFNKVGGIHAIKF